LLGALDQPTSGQVLIAGHDLDKMNDDARTLLRRDKIGFVFQFFNLLPTLTARENVLLPAKLSGRCSKDVEQRADDLLARVGLSSRSHHRPDQLSGGEMQRVAISRALIMDPPVLLADEPTGNLDSKTGREVMRLLRGAVDKRRTVILVTHDPRIARVADRVLTIKDGELAGDEVGSAEGADAVMLGASDNSRPLEVVPDLMGQAARA
jgi:putative ABC transport system ATP-binding protein